MKASDWVLARPWAITEEALGVIVSIADRTNESPEAVEAKMGRPLDNTREVVTRDGVAIIPIVGPISRYGDFFSRISGATDIETLAKDFRTALDSYAVKAIVLQMDTPGGTVSGVAEFASHVAEARGKKPIVAYVGSQAASAGYWIASAADQVVMDSTATAGSIGVVIGMRKPGEPRPGDSKTIEFVSSQSPRKRVDPETEAGKAVIQTTADDLADVFVNAVASYRGVTREKVLADFGQGGSFVGQKAVDAGMADGLGSLEGVIASLAQGEMPCQKPQPKPAKKADSQPRRVAMSEPNESMSAAEAADLRKQLADAKQQKADAEASARTAVLEAVKDRAEAFATDVIVAQRKAVPAEKPDLVKAFTQAALDDHAHPVAGQPTARQDQIRTLYVNRTPHTLTKERTASDPSQEDRATTRLLGTDPADPDPKAKELDEIDKAARAYAVRANGKK